MKPSKAEILEEYGPFPGVAQVNGVTFDGHDVWMAVGDKLHAVDPHNGTLQRTLDVAAQAGTAFDGEHLYQLADGRIDKLDPTSGRVLASIPAPGEGHNSGLAWAEGSLWVGEYQARRIHQIDPVTGAIQRTIETTRYVTGVSWIDGELWHGSWEDETGDLRRIDPASGEVLAQLDMPPDTIVSGLESDGGDRFFCGGGTSGKLRVVRKPTSKLTIA